MVAFPGTHSSTKSTPSGGHPSVPVGPFSLDTSYVDLCRRTLLMDRSSYRVQCGWLARLASCSDFRVWEVRLRSLLLLLSLLSVSTFHTVRTFFLSSLSLSLDTNTVSTRHSHRPPRNSRQTLRPRSFPSRCHVFPRLNRRRRLDRLHLHRLHPPRAQPRRFTDAELRDCRCGDRHHV